MANWNLSVDLRGHGNDLAQSLKIAARHARTLGSNARTAKTEVRELGQASQTAARHIRTLGSAANTAQRHINRLGDQANTTARRLNRYGDAARTANRQLTGLGSNSAAAGRHLARMSGQIDTAVRDLIRLADAARRADTRLNAVGNNGLNGIRRYREETGRLRDHLKYVAGLMSGGALTMGAAELIKEGNAYQQAMNAFGATTGASAMQMQRAAAVADQLGNDLQLPGATAADAAESMVELAKAGFRTDQAISSTRASLVLASAAQVNAADSAKYLGDMMDQFGMGADQAQVAADTLAATANAASGDIIDIYYAMKYAGPVAHGLGVTMQEAAAGVGMLGKAGILGQTAGTTLRGMFANLAAPTKQMKEGLSALGIEAWDAQGQFKGLRNVIDGLSKAQHEMTQQDFAAAVKKAFGKPAMSGAIAMAHQGTDSFDALMQSVSQTGAATEIAAAKGKGLAGAMLQLKTQARQTGLTIYDGLAPGLEFLVRGVTDGLNKATPHIKNFFEYLNASATLFGPDIAAAVRREFASIGDAAKGLADPFKDLGGEAVADFLHVLLNAGKAAIDIWHNIVDGVTPVIDAFGDLSGKSDSVSAALDTVVYVLDLAASAASGLSTVLGPIGHLVGSLVSGFAALPAPIQQFAFAALLASRVQPRLASMATTVSGPVRNAFRGLNDDMRLQRTLAAASGQSLSRYGAAVAVLQTRVPVIGRMGEAFRTANNQSTGFAGTLRGIGAAAGSAARSLGTGLVGALGGPWGLAITGAMLGLGYLAKRQQEAAQAAAEHRARIDSLTTALRESNGVVDESVRAIAAQNLMAAKGKDWYGDQKRLIDLAREAKVPFSDLVDAYTNQGGSLKDLQSRLQDVVKAHTVWQTDLESGAGVKAPDQVGKAALALSEALGGVSGDFSQAASDAKAYNEAVKGSEDNVTAYDRLKDAVGALADKTADADTRTRALREALDLLSGGSVSLQAAQARVNEAITNANEALADGVDKADGWGKALLNANGSINTVTKNGQSLFSTLTTIADGSASAATAAYDFAESQGKALPDRMKAAQGEMQKARDAAVSLGQQYGLSKKQAEGVADAMGLIPGQVSILLSTKGVDTTLAELIAVQAEFQQVPNSKTIKVDALGAEAKRQLEELGYKIELIPGTREFKITAPTQAARTQLDLLIAQMAKVPDGKDVKVDAKTAVAIGELNNLSATIKKTPGAKSVTVSALTQTAISALQQVGLKVEHLPNGNVTVSAANGQALGAIGAVSTALANLDGDTATTYVKTVRLGGTGPYRGKEVPAAATGGLVRRATGGPANPVQHFDEGGFIRGPGSPTSDSILATFASGAAALVSDTEYVMRSAAVRKYGVATMDAINRGELNLPRLADGGAVTDWRYDPNTGSLYSASDAGQAGHRTKKVKVKVKGKWETKDVDYFDLATVEKKLKSISKLTIGWNNDLATVADRVGGDVAEALAGMGEDGMALARKMAHGSTKYINEMAAALRNLQKTARASLTDYTRQLGKANSLNKTFSDNLARLAAQGYGDLASQLAEQNDEAAQQLAAAAVKDRRKAAAANAQARTANNALTSEQVSQLVQIIAAITTSKTGIHDVAAKTELGEDEIITIGNKAKSQISKSLGSRATRFLADLNRANRHLSYADGGLRAGIYATQAGIVRFAEPETGGEGFVPLGANKRRTALPVLADIAHRFGLGLTDVSASRPVVIVKEGGDTHVTVTAVRTNASASDIGAQVGWQMRRARRGGVAARAA